jgi:hypothetical protein
MTDWYFTSTAKKQGFTARPVVGGVFLKLLYDAALWGGYASGDVTQSKDWARLPSPPKTKAVVATAASSNDSYRFTTKRPSANWFAVDFDDASWTLGHGGLGSNQTPGAPVATQWNTSDVWLRRTITIDKPGEQILALRIWHDEQSHVYVNGKLATTLEGYTTGYETIEIDAGVFKPGENVVAIHCHQTSGGQFIDFGIDVIEPEVSTK